MIPGFIASSGLDRYPESAHDVLRSVKGRVPLKRHGTESEIAGAIVYLLSEAASYVTGISLRIDGGLHNNARSSFYTVPEGKGTVVVAQASLTQRLPESPEDQLNLIQFARLALHPKPAHLPYLAQQQ